MQVHKESLVGSCATVDVPHYARTHIGERGRPTYFLLRYGGGELDPRCHHQHEAQRHWYPSETSNARSRGASDHPEGGNRQEKYNQGDVNLTENEVDS